MTELSGIQIFKYLPAAAKSEHTNCKECGCPTCMAYAIKLAKHQIDIEKCKYAPQELVQAYTESSKQPQNTVEINGIKIGGENVLYRHEKTFINKTALAVIIDMSKPDWKKKYSRVKDFGITLLNNTLKVDLIITKNGSVENSVKFEEFIQLPLKGITDNNFEKTSQELINIRKKAVTEKDENYSQPVYVYLPASNDLNNLCARASYYICKYANMLVFEDFDENLFTSLMTLRQNIYTDPQKPLQVDSNIYEFNNPDENSLIFLTTNFALTYFAVANELESLDVPSYLIVVPVDGMSVLTAWSAEKFTPKVVANTLKKFNFSQRVKNRTIIIPGLLAHVKDELEEEIKDFNIMVGTVNSYEMRDFVNNLMQSKSAE